jgi:phosphomannomutase/phosphoglucomutase
MVTASHNENGWTGVKMGIKKGLTHAPEEMSELKDITLNKKFVNGKGSIKKIDNFKNVYSNDLIKKIRLIKRLKPLLLVVMEQQEFLHLKS